MKNTIKTFVICGLLMMLSAPISCMNNDLHREQLAERLAAAIARDRVTEERTAAAIEAEKRAAAQKLAAEIEEERAKGDPLIERMQQAVEQKRILAEREQARQALQAEQAKRQEIATKITEANNERRTIKDTLNRYFSSILWRNANRYLSENGAASYNRALHNIEALQKSWERADFDFLERAMQQLIGAMRQLRDFATQIRQTPIPSPEEGEAKIIEKTISPDDIEQAYRVLEISPGNNRDVEPQRIKSAYKRLALQYHPDKADPRRRQAATEKMQELNAAFEKLKNI